MQSHDIVSPIDVSHPYRTTYDFSTRFNAKDKKMAFKKRDAMRKLAQVLVTDACTAVHRTKRETSVQVYLRSGNVLTSGIDMYENGHYVSVRSERTFTHKKGSFNYAPSHGTSSFSFSEKHDTGFLMSADHPAPDMITRSLPLLDVHIPGVSSCIVCQGNAATRHPALQYPMFNNLPRALAYL